MRRAVPPRFPGLIWLPLIPITLLLFRVVTYAFTDFSAGGDGGNYIANAIFIGKHRFLPPLSVQPNAYGWLLSWFHFHEDPALALERIGRAQQALDLFIVAILCWLAQKLLGRSKPWLLIGAWSVLLIQPFTGIWSRSIYSEQMVAFLSFLGFLVLSIFLYSIRNKLITLLGIAGAGLLLGLASVLRSDVLALNTVLLLGMAVYLAFLAGDWLRWRRIKIAAMLLAYVAVPLAMSSYQYASSGEFGIVNNKRLHEGYFGWVRTWPANPREYEVFAFFSQSQSWSRDKYPRKAFDSEDEAKSFSLIMEKWRGQGMKPSALIDSKFRSLAQEKIRRNPLRHYLLNPLQRIYYFWINMDGSQFYTIPFELRRPVSTVAAALIFLARLLLLILFLVGLAGFVIKLKRNHWSLQPESWLAYFSIFSYSYVLLRTLELALLSPFMIAGLMELRFISIAMPFFLVGALAGARQLTTRGEFIPCRRGKAALKQRFI